MGTRSVTKVYNTSKDSPVILSMYRQMDGYYEGHGEELKHFLDGFTIVNGLGCNTPERAANGTGCLAAQLVEHFKSEFGVGGIYLTTVDDSEEYNYHIYLKKKSGKLSLVLEGDNGGRKKFFRLKTKVNQDVCF